MVNDMRLIDADRARETATIDLVVHHLDRQPTIDAVPVVRCKDCDKSEPSNVWAGWIFCRANKVHQKDDNFCSYGERKDGDGND